MHIPGPLQRTLLSSLLLGTRIAAADFEDPNADPNVLPTVPPGFTVTVFAREPLVRQPCSMAFDSQGRLCVGMGPQYRNPRPDTPGDSVVLVLDTDGDGRADRTQVFATGFNAIQSMAWRGRDLWVANAPDLTLVRDLDGDDVADEYVRIYTDLGNLEHGLHGLNWAPDGRLYMSKGNSKGLTQPGRVAPRPFRDLWGVQAPAGTPDFPPPQTFTRTDYRKAYHDPEDDWGLEGGVLRCNPDGSQLEIVSRGMRNPWDITPDPGMNWIGTDNDQTGGDRVLMPFPGAHFGWNHPWSAHWSDSPHAASAPVSGPLFEGSGTGVIHGDSPGFPASHRGVFFVNDWLRKTTFVWRPRWDGALLRPATDGWEPFVQGGRSLYRPTDLEFGPDGALWILGWGTGYGATYRDGQLASEGRVFRVTWDQASSPATLPPRNPLRLDQWPIPELIREFQSPLPVRRINAQDELVRRGPVVRNALIAAFTQPADTASETAAAWTLARLDPADRSLRILMTDTAAAPTRSLNARIQAVRILADHQHQHPDPDGLPSVVITGLRDQEPRIRFESVQALRRAGQKASLPNLLQLLETETDPATYLAAWQTLRLFVQPTALKAHLADPRPGVRQATLLALLESHALLEPEVRAFINDTSPAVQEIARLWIHKAHAGGEAVQVRGRPLAPVVHTPIVSHPALARNPVARSGNPHRVVPGGFRPGARAYADRPYALRDIPAELVGADLLQTANDDDGCQGTNWLEFEVIRPVRVHVALDTRSTHAPAWLRDHFRPESRQIVGDGWKAQLHSCDFPAGIVRLGGNTDDGRAGGKGQYVVAIESLPLPIPDLPTRPEEALARLSTADVQRGEWLFFHPRGAACSHCHQLDGQGNAFGPDLAGIGARATPRHLAESILQPNAVITEGFHLHTIETDAGAVSGILIEESGLNITLGLANGQREVIARSRILARRIDTGSAMPAFDSTLAPGDVADLAAFLLSKTPVAPGDVIEARPRVSTFQFTLHDGHVAIRLGDQPVADFIFKDQHILRPHLANVRAPDGNRVTRTHPPVPGVDATDHDTMHPGIWLGLGDVNGADFWRNKARMEQVRFLRGPALHDDQAGFTIESRLRTADDRILGTVQHRLTFDSLPDAWMLGWDATFLAGPAGITFGDQEEMGFGARVATPITEKNAGRITSSTGLIGAGPTWGQAADWCDYSGTVGGRHLGITLMSHPDNFRPSWWHNRDYGVFVANPFGRAAMKQGEPSRITVNPGDSFRIRFGALIHSSPVPSPNLPATGYRFFIRQSKP